MGASDLVPNECKMKIAVFLLAFATLSYASVDIYPEIYDTPEVELLTSESKVQSLMDAVKHLHAHTPARYAHHVATVTKHAMAAIESSKTKAYVHNFRSTQAAIRAALKALNDELLAGHKHDEAVLKNAKRRHGGSVSSTVGAAKNKVKGYKHKGCPTKRSEENANEKKMKAKKKRDDLGKGKICPLRTTWGDMDVEKAVPKYGSELRNAWDKKRAEWLRHHNAYMSATRVHSSAKTKHDKVMASFRTALNLEASNAKKACDNANAEFETLKRDVASNVATRKQAHISSLVVKCYVDNMTSNSAAKVCADRARKADVSIWNINGGSLAACASTHQLEHSFGPASWTASHTNCKGVWSVTQKVICHNHYQAVGWSTKSPKSLDDCKALCAKIPGCLASGFSYVSSWKQCRLPKPNAPCKAGAYKMGAFYRQQSAEEMFDVSELE